MAITRTRMDTAQVRYEHKVYGILRMFNIIKIIDNCIFNAMLMNNVPVSGSMAALGIMMLLLTVGGVLALLVLVLKW